MVVVVDVLSFSTAVSVAADRGTAVLPYPWAVTDAAAFARAHDAVLARGRSAGPGEVGLSPVSIRSADPPPQPGEPVRWWPACSTAELGLSTGVPVLRDGAFVAG